MNFKNASVRVVFALASVLSTVVTLGSILALADHYNNEAAQWASARPAVVAQR